VVTANAFIDWPTFESELSEGLSRSLDPNAVQRVMRKTQTAYARLQSIDISSKLRREKPDQIRKYEIWIADQCVIRMRMLKVLINSFVAIEEGTAVLNLAY
jgi:hypothetical protein